MMFRVMAIAVVCLIFLDGRADAREWKDTSGKTLKGELVEKKGDSLVIKNEDGKEVTVPLTRFSEIDKTYVESLKPFSGIVAVKLNETKSREAEDAKQQIKKNSKSKLNLEEAFIITSFVQGSPSANKLQVGDIITKFDGASFKSTSDYKVWSDKNFNRSRKCLVWKSSDSYTKTAIVEVPISFLTQDEIKVRAAQVAQEEKQRRVNAAEAAEAEIKAKAINEKIIDLEKVQQKVISVILRPDLFDGKIVPVTNDAVMGLDMVADGRNLYGIIGQYVSTNSHQTEWIAALYIHNNTKKAVRSATFRATFIGKSRTVPYDEVELITTFPGGIEPGETKAAMPISIDNTFIQLPDDIKKRIVDVECRIIVLGYSFSDDEEVGKDALNRRRN